MAADRALVVGGGLGGLRAAEGLRAAGWSGEVLVVGDEPWMPYNRPPLSKEALSEGISHERLAFAVRSTASDVVWRLGARAGSADLDARTVTLDDGEVLDYAVLVAATGVSARRLPLPGPPPTPAGGRHVVRTVDDAARLRERLLPGTRVLVLGAGFIGCEVAATATGLGASATCVALDPFPLVRPLGPVVAAELQRRLEERGVAFRLGVGIDAFLGDDRATGVRLSDGSELVADVVVEALGSRCNVDWLEGNGLDLGDGVLADTALRPLRDGAPVDGVAVVGDVARFPYRRFSDEPLRIEHWNMPTETGRRAGAVLAARLSGQGYAEVVDAPWEPVPSFWSDQFDLRLQSFGIPGLADGDGVRVLEGELSGDCVIGYHRGGDLMGVVAIDMVRASMGYRDRLGRSR